MQFFWFLLSQVCLDKTTKLPGQFIESYYLRILILGLPNLFLESFVWFFSSSNYLFFEISIAQRHFFGHRVGNFMRERLMEKVKEEIERLP
jgi:hypothetical protein